MLNIEETRIERRRHPKNCTESVRSAKLGFLVLETLDTTTLLANSVQAKNEYLYWTPLLGGRALIKINFALITVHLYILRKLYLKYILRKLYVTRVSIIFICSLLSGFSIFFFLLKNHECSCF